MAGSLCSIPYSHWEAGLREGREAWACLGATPEPAGCSLSALHIFTLLRHVFMLPEQNTIYCMIPQGCRGPDSAGWPSAVKTRQSCRQRQDHQPAILSCLHCRWQVSCSIVPMVIVISCIWRVSCSCAVPAIPARLSIECICCRLSTLICMSSTPPADKGQVPHRSKGRSHTDQRAGPTKLSVSVMPQGTAVCPGECSSSVCPHDSAVCKQA